MPVPTTPTLAPKSPWRISRRSRKSVSEKKSMEHLFPSKQLFVLSVCRICEPIAFMSIFPYAYYMIESFKITDDEKQIAIYAGLVTSAFALAEFISGPIWGRMSDRVGRKPILLCGLAGTGLSMLVFGFAQNLWVAVLARALGGLLNGNIGVLTTTVAEVVKVKEHEPRAFARMPFIWCLGALVGSSVGGLLADPVKNYPTVFAPGTVFEKFPYLLPNLVCAAAVVVCVIIGVLFLEETHEEKKHKRDAGLEFGDWLVGRVTRSHSSCGSITIGDTLAPYSKADEACLDETAALLGVSAEATSDSEDSEDEFENDVPVPYNDKGLSAEPLPSTFCPAIDSDSKESLEAKGVTKIFNSQVIRNIVAFGLLAYHTMVFEQLLPVLLSMPKATEPPASPFKFTGGFALSTSSIGIILTLQGVYNMFAQLKLQPYIVERWGSYWTFRATAVVYPFLYLLTPYLVVLPEGPARRSALAVILLFKVTLQAMAYPSNSILTKSNASSNRVLGTINGTGASAASLARAVAPTLSGIVQSAGLSAGYEIWAWWTGAAVALVGLVNSLWLRDPA